MTDPPTDAPLREQDELVAMPTLSESSTAVSITQHDTTNNNIHAELPDGSRHDLVAELGLDGVDDEILLAAIELVDNYVATFGWDLSAFDGNFDGHESSRPS